MTSPRGAMRGTSGAGISGRSLRGCVGDYCLSAAVARAFVHHVGGV